MGWTALAMKPIRDRYDRDADAGLRSSGGPGPDTQPLAPQTSAFPPPTSMPDRAAASRRGSAPSWFLDMIIVLAR